MVYGHSYRGYKWYGVIDCSNFTSLVYGDFGYNITTTARNYNTVGQKVSGVYSTKVNGTYQLKGTNNLKPGDIFTWYGYDNGKKYIWHVAIYMGMINGTPAVIGTKSGRPTAIGIVDDWSYWWGQNLYTVRRVLPESAHTPSKAGNWEMLHSPDPRETGQIRPDCTSLSSQIRLCRSGSSDNRFFRF